MRSATKYPYTPAPLTATLSRVVASVDPLPPNVLLWGAQGCGRGAVARGIADKHNLTFLSPPSSTLDDVRQIVTLLSSRRSRMLLAVRLDGVHERGSELLLKVLEENTTNHVAVIAEHPKPTIISRCMSVRIPPLPADEVAQVLTSAHGISEARAEAACTLSTIPLHAIMLLDALEAGRSNAMAVLRAAEEGDNGLLSAACFNADLATLIALGVFCKEAISGRWGVFTPSDFTALHTIPQQKFVQALEIVNTRRESPRSSTYVVGKLLSAAAKGTR